MNNKGFKLSLLTLAMTGALSSASVWAQDNAKQEEQQASDKLERIEVTARRTNESLQEVPVAVTSVSASELAESGISVMTEIQQFSPNTTLQTSRGTNSTLTAFIR
ncbi:MAG: hypothetical protein CMF17_07680, partial [Idiomarinaceae bacterium]|nr:hypothetical protein [Idiomarinaceae bacterium]